MADLIRPNYGSAWAATGEKVAPDAGKFALGWVQEMMPYQYENYLQARQDEAILYLLQKGIPEYSSTQEYTANKSLVLYNGVVYLATQTVTNVLPTVAASWKRVSTISDNSGVVSVAGGGTGATTQSQARTNLGLGTAATLDAANVVQKDVNGDFTANVITASLAGNASTADKWKTTRTIQLNGAATSSSANIDGSSNVVVSVTTLDASTLTGDVPSTSLVNAVVKTSATGAAKLPKGTTAQRPASPEFGDFRANETTGLVEYWNGSAWVNPSSQSTEYILSKTVEKTSNTGAAILPEGTDAERPAPGATGLYVRFNKTSGKPEWYNRAKSEWKPFGDASGELFNYAWHNGPRSSIDVGRVPTDGQQLLLLTHPDVCQAVWAGKQNAVDESVWQADPTKRNCWSRGDGSSWVRVPDLNAALASTGKPFYLRGGTDALNGTSVGDAIRNITGSFPVTVSLTGAAATGALGTTDAGPAYLGGAAAGRYVNLNFNASYQVPTADENRVKTAYGVWTVRVFTEVSNVGALDAGQLATQLGVVDAKVQNLPKHTYGNKIINGKMEIAQRGTSFVGISASPVPPIYTLDRFRLVGAGTAAVVTASQQADVPSSNEFQYSLRVAVTTADASIGPSEEAALDQTIEGYNARDLIGRPFTLSFWVRSSKTGVHCIAFRNTNNDRSYVAEYTVNVANTWEKKTITVSEGLITSGTWNWTNGQGVQVSWILAAGSSLQTTAGAWRAGNFLATTNQVNCLDTVGNIFAITGVQLEVGEVATPFEHRPYGLELLLCQRYYEEGTFNWTMYQNAGNGFTTTIPFLARKRVTPSISMAGVSAINASNTVIVADTRGITSGALAIATGTVLFAGYYAASAEL